MYEGKCFSVPQHDAVKTTHGKTTQRAIQSRQRPSLHPPHGDSLGTMHNASAGEPSPEGQDSLSSKKTYLEPLGDQLVPSVTAFTALGNALWHEQLRICPMSESKMRRKREV
jgi:hypothetical protein